MTNQSTPRPWKYTISSKNNRPQISGKSGHQICLMWRDGEMDANAKLIVKSVNCHDELVNKLKDLIHQIDINDYVDFHGHEAKMLQALHLARQALSKAQEEI